MLGRQKRILEDLSFSLDVVVSVVLLATVYSLLSAYREPFAGFLTALTGHPFRIEPVSHLGQDRWVLFVILVCQFLALRMTRFYETDLLAPPVQILAGVVKGVFFGASFSLLFFYFFSIDFVNRSLFFGFVALFGTYLATKELLLRHYLRDSYYRRNPLEALLVCGLRDLADLHERFSRPESSTVRICGIVLADPTPRRVPESLQSLYRGGIDQLSKVLSGGQFDLILLGSGHRDPETPDRTVAAAEEQGIEVLYLADFLYPQLAHARIDDFNGHPVIVYHPASHYEGMLLAKRVFDVLLSGFFLVALSPLLTLIAVLIRTSSPGPVFFRQERTGFHGKPFTMLKFRTMTDRAEEARCHLDEANEMSGPVFKVRNDPRITRIGHWLRRFSLDELPQLINVLRGEMSLVGPRPLPVYETEQIEAFRDRRRYSVLPGLTGLWQVSGRNEIRDFRDWVRLDLEYIDRWSIWLDLTILARTVPVVITGQGAR